MNEELQSTHEELQTSNEELRQRSDELKDVNAFLESILTSLRGGVTVVDADLKVLVWNENADDLWGLRSDEVIGHHLLNLDVGLPVDRLKQPLRECLAGQRQCTEMQLDATNRRGKTIRCRVTCSPLLGPNHAVRGAIVMMEDLDAQAVPESRRDGRARRDAEAQLTSFRRMRGASRVERATHDARAEVSAKTSGAPGEPCRPSCPRERDE